MPADVLENAAPDTGVVESVSDGYVESELLGQEPSGSSPADREPAKRTETTRTEPERTDKTVADKTQETTEAPATDVDGLIQQFAKATGLNPNDPNQRKVLKQLADKELHIQKLQGENAKFRGTPTPEKDHLTAMERALLEPEQAVARQDATTARPAAGDGTFKIGDAGDEWKTAIDGHKALEEAYAIQDPRDRHERVRDVENAMFLRRFATTGVPLMTHMIREEFQNLIERHLGDLIPGMRQSVETQKRAQSQQKAVAELRAVPGYESVDILLKPIDDTKLEFAIDGEPEKWPNTPLNRIISQHPELLNIRSDHKDPETARTLTNVLIYRAAMKIQKATEKKGIDPEQAQTLVESGKKMAERERGEGGRFAANSGSGSNGRGSTGGPASYVEELIGNRQGGPIPFSSLFSK